MLRNVVALVALILLVGCSPGEDMASAERGIAVFHDQLNKEQFATIYENSGPELKKSISQAEFVEFLAAVHRKLGPYQSGKTAGWNNNVTAAGHFMTINYAAQYGRGSASENFVWRLGGASAQLIGYHVNSNALVLN